MILVPGLFIFGSPGRFMKLRYYSNVNFFSAGGEVFNADLHYKGPFLFGYFCFAAARSFALLDRGLKTISVLSPVTGFLVSTRSGAS